MLALMIAAALGTTLGPPATPALKTRWAALVSREHPHDEYPRPQLVRDRWMSLNGIWDYAIKPMDAGLDFPAAPDGQIVVPFPLESQLSGVTRSIDKDSRLFYRRTVTLPPTPEGRRVLLHFEAVDWGTKVFLNSAVVGDHTGGYSSFSFDITDRVKAGDNELIVQAWDPCDAPADQSGGYEPPRGKQVRSPEGIWYTSVTGIWQTVWIEWVPERSIDNVTFAPDLVHSTLAITPTVRGAVAEGAAVEVSVRWPENPDGPPVIQAFVPVNKTTVLDVPNVQSWSPETPRLYRVDLRYGADIAKSYVAFRTIEVKRDRLGFPRVLLNGKPYFMLGLLDQGWWPDGLYTAPTIDAMTYDLEVTKALGFNTVRKHVKIEPATWYAACDRIGLLVWQDMPSSGPYIGPADADATRGEESARVYESELLAMIEQRSFFPSIIMWVPFNEGWGQFDTYRIVKLIRERDPTRLVNAASGWIDRGTGDIFDIHDYASSVAGKAPPGDAKRANVFGEFGGLALAVPGHVWSDAGWGYQKFDRPGALEESYARLVSELAEQAIDGISGAIYTQTTDVEVEINGLMTYDRDVIKINSARIGAINRRAIDLANSLVDRGSQTTIVPSGLDEQDASKRPLWRSLEGAAPEGWTARDFDDSSWRESPGGFGTEQTPGAVVGTEWKSSTIAIRRRFTLSEADRPTHLFIHHDEDAEVWVDGTKIATLPGYSSTYGRVQLSPEAIALLTPGEHVLAVRCQQTRGGQFIDAGFVRLTAD
ncbi:MAG: glycoside hydrolase family 2 TIM barrel-domain containing protein [Phycisphaerae bacterium]|nr:glycoside hydrolase family 2 TIM barrel-domain containing protein [Phycisphaerae bacterium]